MENEIASLWLAQWQAWNPKQAVPDLGKFLAQYATANLADKHAVLLQDQRFRWETSNPKSVEEYLQQIPELRGDSERLLQLVVGEFQSRLSSETVVSIDEYTERFSQLSGPVRSRLQQVVATRKSLATVDSANDTFAPQSNLGPLVRPIPLAKPVGIDANATCDTDPSYLNLVTHIGRYRRIRLLGQGAFGFVWLGLDEELQRRVAIKVPRPERFRGPADAEQYLAEARTVAGLDHPHIVPVYDVGRTDIGSIYVVSKFIEGCTLATRLEEQKLSFDETTKLLATAAQALHHAHQQRLVHRDVKPANILIEERTGTTYVADFGLAIREKDFLQDNRLAGTPAYMSPEQARGEGHRLDGRSDIFSLGVVMYEMLTGKRPFRGSTTNELLHQVVSIEPVAPRTLDENIPVELDRICLRALSKRAADRYASASEFADDLSYWHKGSKSSGPVRTITPKGLRSFDADDSDFFLDLLPGPRDRDALPESIRFWKKRIEETDPERTFSVGLILGPSGCGKSSLVKAGLMPRLSKDITTIYIESTPDDTENRILKALRKAAPAVPTDLTLPEAFAWLRREGDKKIVIILDQFEQWLHSHRIEQETELVGALRQCDGGMLKAIIMVRDDFSMAASRFMREIETRIVEGHNFATVDLFDVVHAKNVLIKFGLAFGKLAPVSGKLSPEETDFVSALASGLSQDGKVVSVRLSLFAEMIKSKPWTLQTLTDVGGTEGVGFNFLQETFSSRGANPEHRSHESAARAVLKSLLPDVAIDIKGHVRSHAELLADSGYESRIADFNTLLRILDGELRLITPTDSAGPTDSSQDSSPTSRYYQLTHDYMVPSMREWLTQKQQETRAGRAELKLAERTSLWTVKPENRFLPSLVEWLSIRLLTAKDKWTPPQRTMMRRAGRVYVSRLSAVSATILMLICSGLWIKSRVDLEQSRTTANGLVTAILSAETRDLIKLVDSLTPYRQVADPILQTAVSSEDAKVQLHARIALLPVDPTQAAPLQSALLDAAPEKVLVLRDLLQSHRAEIEESYWNILGSTDDISAQHRLAAGAALAKFTPTDARWTKVAGRVSKLLVDENPLRLAAWIEAFHSVRKSLVPELSAIFRDQSESTSQTQRDLATITLESYAYDNVEQLSELIVDAKPKQFLALFDVFKAHGDAAIQKMVASLNQSSTTDAPRERIAGQQANAALAMTRLGQRETMFAVLRIAGDPESLTQFVHRCRGAGVTSSELVECMELADQKRQSLNGESRRLEDRVLFGLLLALGEFKLAELPEGKRMNVVEKVSTWFSGDPSSAIHGVTGWLLRQWGQADIVKRIDQSPVSYNPKREWFTLEINAGDKRFYQTYIVLEPGDYDIGSPEDAPGRVRDETMNRVHLSRPVAVLDREITRGEFEASGIYKLENTQYSPTIENPMLTTSWFDCVQYCRWLTEQSGLSESDQAYADPESLDEDKYKRDAETGFPKDWPLDIKKRGFRLPTEAEWEIAARGGMQSTFGFGEDLSLLSRYGWFLDNSERQTHSVKELRPNLRGMFDMQGNAFEWCHDWYSAYNTEGITTDPLGAASGTNRVTRSGCRSSIAEQCRLASRNSYHPAIRRGSIGLRVALTPREDESE